MNNSFHSEENVSAPHCTSWQLNPEILGLVPFLTTGPTDTLLVCFYSHSVCFCVWPGLILHEEHIELLTEDYKQLKREIEGKNLQEGTLHFTGKRQECVPLWIWIKTFISI